MAYGLYLGELLTIGVNIMGHFALIIMVFVTWWTFHHYRMLTPRGLALIICAPPTGRGGAMNTYDHEIKFPNIFELIRANTSGLRASSACHGTLPRRELQIGTLFL